MKCINLMGARKENAEPKIIAIISIIKNAHFGDLSGKKHVEGRRREMHTADKADANTRSHTTVL